VGVFIEHVTHEIGCVIEHATHEIGCVRAWIGNVNTRLGV
jgi:hypothetical protein